MRIPHRVLLEGDDLARAEREAARRYAFARSHGMAHSRGLAGRAKKADMLRLDLHGASAELAVALTSGWDWLGEGADGDESLPDVGLRGFPDTYTEVKWTFRHDSGLILKKIDGKRPFIGRHVLVTGTNPYFVLGQYDVTEKDYLWLPVERSLPFPAIVIPQDELLPFPA